MKVVWEKGKATVHEVKDALSHRKKHAYSTILTMMRKIEVKGYLKHEVIDRTFVYYSTISQQTVRRGVLGDILDRFFEGSTSLLLNNLVEQDRISEDELRQIRKIMEERSKK
jgi:predicted transcriptional regulator